MAKVYGQIGSFLRLCDSLKIKNVNVFESFEEIRKLVDNYKEAPEKIKNKKIEELKNEIDEIRNKIEKLKFEYDKEITERKEKLLKEKKELDWFIEVYSRDVNNIFKKIINYYKKRKFIERKEWIEKFFDYELNRPFKSIIDEIKSWQSDLDYRQDNFDKIVEEKYNEEVNFLNLVYNTIKSNKEFYYGAIGEQMVLDKLKSLPDEYTIINNFQHKFSRPVPDRKNNDFIYSVQIDHILVGPTGLYLIETKNWSKNSMDDLDLYSPIKQIKRSSLALFALLNQAIRQGYLSRFLDPWGEEQISPKKILVVINHKPEQEYQFVKILTPGELEKYILNEKVFFTKEQVENLVTYLKSEKNYFHAY